MWRSLVWKEWHEQRWRLGFGIFLVGTFTLIGLRTRIVPDEQIVLFSVMIGGMFFPLMVAMGMVAPERAEGTIVRLLALPVPIWKVLAAKALVGGIVCASPMIVSAVIASVIAGDREMAWGELVGFYAMAVGVTFSVFTWLTSAGVRQPSEARVGLVGIGLFVGWFLIIGALSALGSELYEDRSLDEWVAAACPLGFMALKSDMVPPAGVIAVQLCGIAAMWCWAAWRIGKPGKVVA
jgi:ABC-type transport system involved in multi-copper enzyme maturation permease subunit